MKRSLLVVLGIGIGWLIGITLVMILMPVSEALIPYDFEQALGNTLLFGFPGLVMLMIALILSVRDDIDVNPYEGEF